MTLVERRTALYALSAGLTESAGGAGCAVVVTGGPATGKTELLTAFAAQAAESGAFTVTAAGARGERDLAMCVADQLAAAIGAPDLVTGVLDLARDHTVVLLIDDVHYVDDASLRVLLALRERMHTARVLLVAAGRQTLDSDAAGWDVWLARAADRRVRLGPLTREGVRALAAAELGHEDGDPLVWHRISGGNPLLVRALVTDHLTGAVPGLAFRHAVTDCLHRGDAHTTAVAEALAVLGSRAPVDVVAAVSGVDRRAVGAAVPTLSGAGLVVDGALVSAEVRDAVLDGLAAGQATRLRLSAAEALHLAGAGATEVAEHLVGADEADPGWGVGVLREAARDADAPFAVRCLELAARRVADSATRAEVLAELARAQWRVDPTNRWPDALDPLISARYRLWHSPSAVEGLVGLDAVAAAELRISDAWVHCRVSGFGASHVPWGAAAAALLPSLMDGDHTAVVSAAEEVLARCDLNDHTVETLTAALLALTWADHPVAARAHGDRLMTEAIRGGATTWLAVLQAVRADIALRLGDIAAARRMAEDAFTMLPARSWGVMIGLPLSVMLRADTILGDHAAGAAVLRHVVPEAMDGTVFGLRYLGARAAHYLATDRLLAAAADFQECGRAMVGGRVDLPSLVPWRSGLAEAHLRLGSAGVAVRLVRQQLGMPSARGHARAVSLWVLARAGERLPGIGLLREAADGFTASGDRVSAALVLAELSRSLTLMGQPVRARAVARTALRAGRAAGIGDMVTAALGERRERVTAEPALGLSEAETRVATLAALGHTNRDIADRLYLTVSTVEQHLTRVYRKLGVRRRSDLPSALR